MCHNCQKEYFQQKIESPPPPRSTSWPSARRLVLLVLVPRELQLHPLLQGVHGVDRALHAAHCSNSKLACINSIAQSGSSCKQKSIKHKIVELLLLLGDLSVYLLLGLGEQQLRMKHTVLLLLDRTLGLQMAPLLVQLVDGAASIS